MDDEMFSDPAWSDEIDRLYPPAAFRHPPGPVSTGVKAAVDGGGGPADPHDGNRGAALPDRDQTAVAVQLLRRCQWSDGPAADRFRRGHGCRIALAALASHERPLHSTRPRRPGLRAPRQ